MVTGGGDNLRGAGPWGEGEVEDECQVRDEGWPATQAGHFRCCGLTSKTRLVSTDNRCNKVNFEGKGRKGKK